MHARYCLQAGAICGALGSQQVSLQPYNPHGTWHPWRHGDSNLIAPQPPHPPAASACQNSIAGSARPGPPGMHAKLYCYPVGRERASTCDAMPPDGAHRGARARSASLEPYSLLKPNALGPTVPCASKAVFTTEEILGAAPPSLLSVDWNIPGIESKRGRQQGRPRPAREQHRICAAHAGWYTARAHAPHHLCRITP